MTHNQHTTTTVQVQMTGRTILDCLMHKLARNKRCYRVALIVPDNGIPIIEYQQASNSKKPKKSIQFINLLFADRKHDIQEKFAFSLYTTDKTTTFLAQDETTMNEWLGKIKECHSNIYPEFKRYDAIFEANLLDKGLAKTMHIRGPHRLALCRDSLDFIPLLPTPYLPSKEPPATEPTSHIPLRNKQRFCKRHPLLSSNIIELVLKSIRRCGHTDCNFYIESGRHSQIGEGDLWMTLNKKSTAQQLHELLLATMKLASTTEEPFLYKAPRSRSGSSKTLIAATAMAASSAAAAKAASLSSSLTSPLSQSPPLPESVNTTPTNQPVTPSAIEAMAMLFKSSNKIEEDSGYLPMA